MQNVTLNALNTCMYNRLKIVNINVLSYILLVVVFAVVKVAVVRIKNLSL